MPFEIKVKDIELLSTTVAGEGEAARLILSVRLNPQQSAEVTNLALTPIQSVRLMGDVANLFKVNEPLKAAVHDNHLITQYNILYNQFYGSTNGEAVSITEEQRPPVMGIRKKRAARKKPKGEKE